MNRRQLIMLSGTALAVSEVSKAQPVGGSTTAESAMALIKYTRARASYKIPKTEKKAIKYVGGLSAALALTIDQQQSAAQIFQTAGTLRAGLHGQIKTARKSLRDAVLANDGGAIAQTAAAIGNLKSQLTAAGASAHSAFFQLLTPEQQARVLQYRS